MRQTHQRLVLLTLGHISTMALLQDACSYVQLLADTVQVWQPLSTDICKQAFVTCFNGESIISSEPFIRLSCM